MSPDIPDDDFIRYVRPIGQDNPDDDQDAINDLDIPDDDNDQPAINDESDENVINPADDTIGPDDGIERLAGMNLKTSYSNCKYQPLNRIC